MKRPIAKRWSLLASALMVAGVVATPMAAAQAQGNAGANNGAVKFNANLDFTTAYFFRGILQQKNGVIAQPSASLDFNLFHNGSGFVKSADVVLGTWDSVHSKQVNQNILFETDYSGGVSLGLPDHFNLSSSYVTLTSPAGAFGDVQEIDTTLSYDDTGMWNDMFGGVMKGISLQPYAMYAVELTGGANHSSGGYGYGKYLEAGINPSLTLVHSERYPITLSVPMKVGLSVGNYYQRLGNHQNNVWGYASVGTDLSMPLHCIPARYGQWSVHVGGEYMWLNNDLARANGNNGFQAIGTVGISMSY